MLLEDAELNSSVDGGPPTPSASKGRGGAGAAAEEEALLVSALDTTGWRSLAEWIREMRGYIKKLTKLEPEWKAQLKNRNSSKL